MRFRHRFFIQFAIVCIPFEITHAIHVSQICPNFNPNTNSNTFVRIAFACATFFCHLYHWDQIIRLIAEVEGIADYTSLSQSRRRTLVNKYPLFVAWYCSVLLELVLKTMVVPILKGHSYFAVFEWSPTGGMAHLHYVLWKSRAPRFDVRAEKLLADAEALRKAGLVAAAHVDCPISDVVDFFADYISEWNPSKDADGEDLQSHVAEDVNQAQIHPASLSIEDMLHLLRDEPEAASERFAYYQRAVRAEHIHDFHYPDPLGPPNPSQPCARLLKGTMNMWYCGSGYPREVVREPGEQTIAQDPLRPDLWRVNLCRNCQLMNPHIPLMEDNQPRICDFLERCNHQFL